MQTQNYRDITWEDGYFKAAKTILCDRCRHPVCADFAAMRCEDFSFTLKFKPPIRGFENNPVNTFRLGEVWGRRLKQGSIIALMNAKTSEVFGHAQVIVVHVGDKHEMAKQHGRFNHNIIALDIRDNIAETLLKRVKNSSGSMIYNNNDKATVIYLRILHE